MSEASTPVFQIQRVYMKEASLEQPNSPGILLEQQQPAVDIQLGVEANQAAEGVYEICVTATVHTKIEDKTVFLVECKQAGILRLAICKKTKWAPSWALLALKLCTPTCAATWPTWSPVQAFPLCTWPKLISKPCTSNSKLRLQKKLQPRKFSNLPRDP